MVRKLSSITHHFQFWLDWSVGTSPEWYDHELGVHWQMEAMRNTMFMERGFLGTMASEPGGRVLVLCSGDGFHARNCYSSMAKDVIAVDFDAEAIKFARRVHPAPNLEYRQLDVRTEIPEGPFDLIAWDAAIEHFTEEEISAVLAEIGERLSTDGVLTGYTIVAHPVPGEKHAPLHEFEFATKEELYNTLRRQFRHVVVFQTSSPGRENLYFCASHSPKQIPFAAENARFVLS